MFVTFVNPAKIWIFCISPLEIESLGVIYNSISG